MTTATPATVEGATSLLQSAIDAVRGLSPETQDEIARAMLDWAAQGEDLVIAMSPEEEDSFDESIAQEERGEFVPDDQVRDFWAKVGV